ncbi:MAG: ABC transporter permease [Actinomycetota bacterium]|nr:ABC transporter permease [Actinomycetota bacterium]
MTRSPRRRFWLDLALAILSSALFLLTLVWRDWIEKLTGLRPDGGSGSVEWAIVAVLFALAVWLITLTTREWRATPITG